MAKTKQIASIQYPGYRIVIIRHYDQKINPFYIVKKWEGYNEKNYWQEHSQTLERYDNWHSCLHYLLQLPDIDRFSK